MQISEEEKRMSEKRDLGSMTVEVEMTCAGCEGLGEVGFTFKKTGQSIMGKCPACYGRPHWKENMTLAALKELLGREESTDE